MKYYTREMMCIQEHHRKKSGVFFSELIANKVENKPYMARFLSYLVGVLDLNLYRVFHGNAAILKAKTCGCGFICHV